MPGWLLPAIELAIGAGSATYGALKKTEIPDEMQEYYDMLKKTAREGIPQDVESQMLTTGTTRISQQANAMQRRGASATASRGTSASSDADAMIASVNQTAAQMYSDLQTSIMRMDQMRKAQAEAALGGAAGAITEYETAADKAKGQMIGAGITTLTDPSIWGRLMGDPTELEQLLQLLMMSQPNVAE